MTKTLTSPKQDPITLLRFLKTRTHAYHLSNLFFRDFHYAVIAFSESQGRKISYGKAEEEAVLIIAELEKSGVLRLVKPGSWMLNFPEFKKEPVKPVAAAKTIPAATPKPAASDSIPLAPSPGATPTAAA